MQEPPRALKFQVAKLPMFEMAYFDEGAGPVLLCLHGFPDTAWSWGAAIRTWVAAGYRVVAPFMRGYFPSGLARDGQYGMAHLGSDVLALMDALGIEKAVVVGHDWGACAAFMAATTAPERVDGLVMAAVPPMRAFEAHLTWRGASTLVGQARRSSYMAFFQLPYLSERWVRWRNFAYLERLWRRWSPGWAFSDDALDPVRRALQGPHLTAALSYYRHSLGQRGNAIVSGGFRRKIEVPALFMRGAQDGCIGPALFEHLESSSKAPFTCVTMTDAGHFMQAERPELFASHVLRFATGLREVREG